MCALWDIIEVEEVETELKVISLGSISEFGTPNVEKRFTLIGAILKPLLDNAFKLEYNCSNTIPSRPRPWLTRLVFLMHQWEHKSPPHEKILPQGKSFSTFSPNIIVLILFFNCYKFYFSILLQVYFNFAFQVCFNFAFQICFNLDFQLF